MLQPMGKGRVLFFIILVLRMGACESLCIMVTGRILTLKIDDSYITYSKSKADNCAKNLMTAYG